MPTACPTGTSSLTSRANAGNDRQKQITNESKIADNLLLILFFIAFIPLHIIFNVRAQNIIISLWLWQMKKLYANVLSISKSAKA